MVARIQIPFAVETQVEISAQKVVAPVVGATITVKNRETKAPVSIFAAETGASTIPSPVTDENGNIPGWLEEGSYIITVSGGSPAISPVEKPWDAVSGEGVSFVANGVITPAMLTSATSQLLVPTGLILPFGGSILPTGYIWAVGENVSRTTYSTLFSAYGTKWGTGNGTTTFGTPDLRGRSAVGADNFGGAGAAGRLSEKTFASDGLKNQNTLAGSGGQQQHVLSEFELAEHNHTATSTDFGHYHLPPSGYFFAGWDETFGHGTKFVVNFEPFEGFNVEGRSYGWTEFACSNPYDLTGTRTASADIGTTVFYRGRNEAHNNMPPYQACAWVIKT